MSYHWDLSWKPNFMNITDGLECSLLRWNMIDSKIEEETWQKHPICSQHRIIVHTHNFVCNIITKEASLVEKDAQTHTHTHTHTHTQVAFCYAWIQFTLQNIFEAKFIYLELGNKGYYDCESLKGIAKVPSLELKRYICNIQSENVNYFISTKEYL